MLHVVIGDSGSGKSTLLQSIAYSHAVAATPGKAPAALELPSSDAAARVPPASLVSFERVIRIRLRDVPGAVRNAWQGCLTVRDVLPLLLCWLLPRALTSCMRDMLVLCRLARLLQRWSLMRTASPPPPTTWEHLRYGRRRRGGRFKRTAYPLHYPTLQAELFAWPAARRTLWLFDGYDEIAAAAPDQCCGRTLGKAVADAHALHTAKGPRGEDLGSAAQTHIAEPTASNAGMRISEEEGDTAAVYAQVCGGYGVNMGVVKSAVVVWAGVVGRREG
jgi:hypothetical protein